MSPWGILRRDRWLECVTVALAALVASLVPLAVTNAPASAASITEPPRDNVAFFYEQVAGFTDAELKYKLAGAAFVIVGQQGDPDRSDYWTIESRAASRIAATGAVPIHYVEYVWRRTDQDSFGIDLSTHPQWRVCYSTGGVVSAARDRASGGYYIDMNERDARVAADTYMYRLKQAGYKGLFYDIGRRTFVHGLPHIKPDGTTIKLANTRSGCTGNPVASGRTVSETYAALMDNMRVKHHMFTVVNCCAPGDLSHSGVAGATHVRDVTNRFVNEATKYFVDWKTIQHDNAESQASKRVWNFQCGESPHWALYSWARAKMWHQPVMVNTGEGSTSGDCIHASNQHGLWGELSNARLGQPLDSSYKRGQCEPGSTSLCFFWRRYTNGLVVVNNGRYTLGSGGPVPLTGGSMPSCVYLGEVQVPAGGTGDRLVYPVGRVNNRCISSATPTAGKYEGRVFIYRSSPWP
jgi:hypothetical protein